MNASAPHENPLQARYQAHRRLWALLNGRPYVEDGGKPLGRGKKTNAEAQPNPTGRCA